MAPNNFPVKPSGPLTTALDCLKADVSHLSIRQTRPEKRRDLSVNEICYELSVSRGWVVKRLGTAEVPPYIRRGKFILFPYEKFLEWKQRQRVYGEQNV